MKKTLFGYNISEVNTILDSLREENKSLNSTINILKLRIKNIDDDSNAKSILLEKDLKKYEENLVSLNIEKMDLEKQLNSLVEKYESSTKQNEDLNNQIQYLYKENAYLTKQLSESKNETKNVKREITLTDDKSQNVDSFRKEIIRYIDESLKDYKQLVNNNNKLSESTKRDPLKYNNMVNELYIKAASFFTELANIDIQNKSSFNKEI